MECALENITIYYEIFGEGKPIIILPGWGLNTRLTAHEMEPYFAGREGWKRIYIDPLDTARPPGKIGSPIKTKCWKFCLLALIS